MDRLRAPPSRLALRVLLLCLVMAEVLLFAGGGTWRDGVRLVIGTISPADDGMSALRVLLGRGLASFSLIALALLIGLSFPFAVALLLTPLGGRVSRFAGWTGRALSGLPPMALALGLIVLLIRKLGLPVETLFPYSPPPESDTFSLSAGRELWSWIVPAAALSAPVAGVALFFLTHHLSAMLRNPELARLRARGLPDGQILHRHLVPLLGTQLARMARPCAGMLLAWDIPVEQLLGFDGWGRFAASVLSSGAPAPRALAALMWSGGVMLSALLTLLSLLDRRAPVESGEDAPSGTQRRSWPSVTTGTLLTTALATLPWWLPESPRLEGLRNAQMMQSFELVRVLTVSTGALVLVLAAGITLPALGKTMGAACALAPLLAALLFWEHLAGRNLVGIGVALAVPGIAAFRDLLDELRARGCVEASRMLGAKEPAVWWRHILPEALPALCNWTLRNMGAAFVIFSILDFYSTSPSLPPTWGRLMRANADTVLDDPLPALAPALLIALWSLSFRLLSRAFRTDTPQPRTSPFAP